jgi:hypothetical protein
MIFSGFIEYHVSLGSKHEMSCEEAQIAHDKSTGWMCIMCMGVKILTVLLRLTPMIAAEDGSETGKNLLHMVG